MKNFNLIKERGQSGKIMSAPPSNECPIDWEAKTQYNDFKGSIAADGRDPDNAQVLNEFLKGKGVDTDRYVAVGFEIYVSENSQFNLWIYCKDNQTPVILERFNIAKSFHLKELMPLLFKRINIKAFYTEELEFELTCMNSQTI